MHDDPTPPAASSSNAPVPLPPHPLEYLPPARAAEYVADVEEMAALRRANAHHAATDSKKTDADLRPLDGAR